MQSDAPRKDHPIHDDPLPRAFASRAIFLPLNFCQLAGQPIQCSIIPRICLLLAHAARDSRHASLVQSSNAWIEFGASQPRILHIVVGVHARSYDRLRSAHSFAQPKIRTMQKIVQGIHQFQSDLFSEQQSLFEGLVDGQSPLALFITCSDSRIDPSLLTQTDPGELFILRNAGNIVPSYGAFEGGEAATIEYAVSVLGVKDIIICGHSHCGAMDGLINQSQLEKLPAVRAWLAHAESTHRIVEENYGHITEPTARLTAAVEENVLVQLEQLRTHPSVAAALSRKAINLHGWVYKFETGQVFSFDPAQCQFRPLQDASLATPAPLRGLPPI